MSMEDDEGTFSIARGRLARAGRLVKLAAGLAVDGLKGTQLQQAARVVKELGALKGAAMKAGQMIALEARDFLPEEVVQVLEGIHNQVSFMPKAEALRVLHEDLGQRASALENFSATPLAAASIGQVHRAVLHGRPVAVKIQYPHVRQSIESDLAVLSSVMKSLAAIFRRDVNFDPLLKEFAEIFLQETDYLQEAEFTRRYGEKARAFPEWAVPEVFPDHSSARVLTLSFESGLILPDWLRANRPSLKEREQAGNWILSNYTEEFCSWGLVQTDPNLGNFLFRPDQMVLLDFGATKSYEPGFRRDYARLVMAIHGGDAEEILHIAMEMGLLDRREPGSARKVFVELVTASMSSFSGGAFNFADTEYLPRVRTLSRQLIRELKYSPPPRDLIFLHRKLGGIFQMLRRLEVRMDLAPYLERFRGMAAAGL